MIDGEEKTFVAPFLKGRLYKDFFDIQKRLKSNITPESMDIMIDFVCRVYGNQFTIDDYWDGVPLNKTLSEIVRTVNEIGQMIASDVQGDDQHTHG